MPPKPHKALDAAVTAAYGWDDYSPAMADEDILRRLRAMNPERGNGVQGIKENRIVKNISRFSM